MATEEKLDGARNAFTFFYAYQDAVGRKIGMQQAVELAGMVDEEMGAAQGRLMKEQSGIKEIDIKTATSMVLGSLKEAFGFTSQLVEESPEKSVFRCGRCPIYEAGQIIGMDAGTIESQCRVGPFRFMNAMVKQLNPKFSYQLTKFRTSANDFCEEAIVLS